MQHSLSTLFCLIALFFLVLFIIGLFQPRTALFWSKKPATRKRAIIFNGLAMLLFFILCGLLAPNLPQDAATKTKDAAGSDSHPAPTPAPPSYKFSVINTERHGSDLYLKIIMDDFYPREALIEKAREIKEEYKSADKIVCSFYYKKCTDNTNPVAGLAYLPDCGHCEYKDKDGHLIDFPYYHIEKPLADSLRALKFDTAGYVVEARYYSYGARSIQIILSSKGSRSLLVFQGTTGYFATALVKKTVKSQDRFYDPEEEDIYYVVNRPDGFVELYKNKGLDLQSVIEY
jgi:hypothetical protein